MPNITCLFPIKSTRAEVFRAISTPEGLDKWWTKTCSGASHTGAEFSLGFGPEYTWRATVSRYIPDSEFELHIGKSDGDWRDTRLNFRLTEKRGVTEVDFRHLGWPTENEHYRVSCYCWSMYLRLLRRYVEFGESVPYEDRLDV